MKIILASQSGVRKQILDKYSIENEVIVSNVDEDEVKESLLNEGADPLSISKNLAESQGRLLRDGRTSNTIRLPGWT